MKQNAFRFVVVVVVVVVALRGKLCRNGIESIFFY